MEADVDDDHKEGLERDVVAQWHEFLDEGALTLEQPVIVATAQA